MSDRYVKIIDLTNSAKSAHDDFISARNGGSPQDELQQLANVAQKAVLDALTVLDTDFPHPVDVDGERKEELIAGVVDIFTDGVAHAIRDGEIEYTADLLSKYPEEIVAIFALRVMRLRGMLFPFAPQFRDYGKDIEITHPVSLAKFTEKYGDYLYAGSYMK